MTHTRCGQWSGHICHITHDQMRNFGASVMYVQEILNMQSLPSVLKNNNTVKVLKQYVYLSVRFRDSVEFFYFFKLEQVVIIMCFCLSLDTEKKRVRLRKYDWQRENHSKNKHCLHFKCAFVPCRVIMQETAQHGGNDFVFLCFSVVSAKFSQLTQCI